ncbi:MAG TPA: ABC transporter ATP-binding protein [Methylomirabilota bacterium]|jgi:ABC-type sugar transport system ATPase subunit
MARIDLINVCKTLDERERVRTGAYAAAMTGAVSATSVARAPAFSIQNLNLTVHDGETVVVLGPSGCGKTTLLRLIAGLIPTDSGVVRYDGTDVTHLPPGERRIGMVFQNYALYPHLVSRTNVLSYFLFKKKTPELTELARAKYQRTSELMGVDLAHLLDRKPGTLSGGEKQRVALGRCITRDPAVFLLDEPFSNLDQTLREKYRVNLKMLLRQFDVSTVYVTHDHVEALILADRLAVMNHGAIEQMGTYDEIYREPRSAFVAGFLNRHVGTPPISIISADLMPPRYRLGDVQVGVRPEDVALSAPLPDDGIPGRVTDRLSLPMMNAAMLTVRVAGHEVYVQTAADTALAPGDPVRLDFTRFHVFDRGGTRLATYPDTSVRGDSSPAR